MFASREEDNHDVAEKIANTHDCPDCLHKSRLVCRWHAATQQYEAACGRCGRTEDFQPRRSLVQIWRENPEAVPVQIANKLEEKFGGRPMVAQDKALVPIDQQEQALVKRFDEARFYTELKPYERATLAHLAVKYDLDPIFGELTWYESKPYISVGGYERIARKSGELRGLMCVPMTKAEREQWGDKYVKAAYAFICTVRVKDWPDPVIGTGTADPANPYRGNIVEKARPERMAKARAIRDALKQAFPHMLPSELHVADEINRAGSKVTVVDSETGEIVNGPAPGNSHHSAVDYEEAEVVSPARAASEPAAAPTASEPDLEPAVDAADAPEPTALDEADAERLASGRQELLDSLRELAPTKWRAGWKGLQGWWASYFPDTPETADLETLRKAYNQLTQVKR